MGRKRATLSAYDVSIRNTATVVIATAAAAAAIGAARSWCGERVCRYLSDLLLSGGERGETTTWYSVLHHRNS